MSNFERVKAAIIQDCQEIGEVDVTEILNHENLTDLSGEEIYAVWDQLVAEKFIIEDGYYWTLAS